MSRASSDKQNPANLIGIDYHAVPPRRVTTPIVDIHSHVYRCRQTARFMDVAAKFGVRRIVSMSPLEEAPALRDEYGDRLEFIAVPTWKNVERNEAFVREYMQQMDGFRALGSRICKFWMAPRMRGEHKLTLDHPLLRPAVEHAVDLGFFIMVHIGDPSVWFRPGGKYADVKKFGTKRDQYDQLEWLLEKVAPRAVIGAHMGGSVEELDFLQSLLDRFPHYVIDTSATKWIVREVARQPDAVRAFIIRNADRILFGSDLVVRDTYDTFDHYASRYWAHQMMWETDYRGGSPIADPDAEDPPQLAGVNLPDDVLRRIYVENAQRLDLLATPMSAD